MQPFTKPLLPSYYEAWCEPPDESGDEILRIVSARRSLTLKGHSFREFYRHVIPLLDGRHTFEEICAETADLFDRADLESALTLLGNQKIVVENHQLLAPAPRLQPQLNYFHEMAEDAQGAQQHLSKSRIVVFGLGGAGASVMHALSAAGIGTVVGVDHSVVSAADTYLSPAYCLNDISRLRADVLVDRIGTTAPEVSASAVTARPDTEDDIASIIVGADFVVSCLDVGLLNLAYKLNRVCRANGIRWLSGELDGTEVIAGPGFYGDDGPCFMCYRMRSVACAGNPQTRFAQERHFDKAKVDMGNQRESLVVGTGLLASMLGAEVMNVLSGQSEAALDGRMICFNLTTLKQQKHVILRKPGCPVCMARRST